MAILVEDQGTGAERIERYFLRCVTTNCAHGLFFIGLMAMPLDEVKQMAVLHNETYHKNGPDDGLVIIDLLYKLNLREAYIELSKNQLLDANESIYGEI